MSNEVKSINGITLGNIKNLNGQTDSDIKNVNGQTFVSAIPPDAFTITNYQFNGARSWATAMAWCKETDTLVVTYGDDGNGDYVTYRLGKLNASTGNVTITWHAETVIATAGAGYNTQPVFMSGESSGGNGRIGIVYLESGASATNRYSIIFGTITNSGANPSMSLGTPEVIHPTSSGIYNQGDVSCNARYWEDMGAVVTALEYGDDDGDANFVKAYKMNTSDNSVISSGNNELMFADTTAEFYNIEYDSSINRLVVFSVQYVGPSATQYIYGNILDFNASSTNGLELELEQSLPGTQLFAGTVASSYDAGPWCAYNASANIHHVLLKETADSLSLIHI